MAKFCMLFDDIRGYLEFSVLQGSNQSIRGSPSGKAVRSKVELLNTPNFHGTYMSFDEIKS